MAPRSAALSILLKDGVTAAARKVGTALGMLDRQLARFGTGGRGGAQRGVRQIDLIERKLGKLEGRARRMSRVVGGGAGFFGGGLIVGGAARTVYDMNKDINTMLAKTFGPTGEATLDGAKVSMAEFRDELRKLVHEVNKITPLTPADLFQQAVQLKTAGLTPDAVFRTLDEMARYAVASDQNPGEAADKATNIATMFKMDMSTPAKAEEALRRVSDVVTFTADRTNSTATQMQEAFKFVGPLAQKVGLDIEYVASAFEVMARRGIKANEAGIAFRAMIVRLIRPTKAGREIMKGLGMDLQDYAKKGTPLEAGELQRRLAETFGYDATAADMTFMEKTLKSDKAIADKKVELVGHLAKSMGAGAEERALLAATINSAYEGQIQEYDMERLIKDLTEQVDSGALTTADFLRVFDVRQGARTIPVFSSDENLQKLRDEIVSGSRGYTQRAVEIMMGGIVGAVARARAAWELLIDTMAESGVLRDVVNILENISGALRDISEYDKELLRFGTWAVIGAASLTGLGLVIGGLATAFGVLSFPLSAVVAALGTFAYFNWGALEGLFGVFERGLDEKTAERWKSFKEDTLQGLQDFWKWLSGQEADSGDKAAKWAWEYGNALAELANDINALVTSIENLRNAPGVKQIIDGLIGAADWVENSDSILAQSVRKTLNPLGELGSYKKDENPVPPSGTFHKDFEQFDKLLDEYEYLVNKFENAPNANAATIGFEITKVLGQMEALVSKMQGLGPQANTDGSQLANQLGEGIRSGSDQTLQAMLELIQKLRNAAANANIKIPVGVQQKGSIAGQGSSVPGRAAGGMVTGGRVYAVNEKGPELLVPGGNGRVVPANQLGGGGPVSVSNTFNIKAVNPQAAANEIARILDDQLQRSRQLSMDGRPVYG